MSLVVDDSRTTIRLHISYIKEFQVVRKLLATTSFKIILA